LFELLEKMMRDHSDLAARYTAMLRGMYRSKSERISSDQLALSWPSFPPTRRPRLPTSRRPRLRRRLRPSHRLGRPTADRRRPDR
jgi:hypothetical protein